jgi:hypothetical protein
LKQKYFDKIFLDIARRIPKKVAAFGANLTRIDSQRYPHMHRRNGDM